MIYVVTSGDYSDYSIKSIFSSEELAKEWIAKSNNCDYVEAYTIEPWELDGDATAEWMTIWSCAILLDTGEIKEQGERRELRNPFRGETYQSAVKVPCYNNRLISRVRSGVSQEHAEKLACEERQAWLREKIEGSGV